MTHKSPSQQRDAEREMVRKALSVPSRRMYGPAAWAKLEADTWERGRRIEDEILGYRATVANSATVREEA